MWFCWSTANVVTAFNVRVGALDNQRWRRDQRQSQGLLGWCASTVSIDGALAEQHRCPNEETRLDHTWYWRRQQSPWCRHFLCKISHFLRQRFECICTPLCHLSVRWTRVTQFQEGVMTKGYATSATDAAVQANSKILRAPVAAIHA